jgi:hypothetical protein
MSRDISFGVCFLLIDIPEKVMLWIENVKNENKDTFWSQIFLKRICVKVKLKSQMLKKFKMFEQSKYNNKYKFQKKYKNVFETVLKRKKRS